MQTSLGGDPRSGPPRRITGRAACEIFEARRRIGSRLGLRTSAVLPAASAFPAAAGSCVAGTSDGDPEGDGTEEASSGAVAPRIRDPLCNRLGGFKGVGR